MSQVHLRCWLDTKHLYWLQPFAESAHAADGTKCQILTTSA